MIVHPCQLLVDRLLRQPNRGIRYLACLLAGVNRTVTQALLFHQMGAIYRTMVGRNPFIIQGIIELVSGPPSNGEKEASVARTNYGIPSVCGIYYFEVEIQGKEQKA